MDDLQVKNCSSSSSDYKLWFSSQALQKFPVQGDSGGEECPPPGKAH